MDSYVHLHNSVEMRGFGMKRVFTVFLIVVLAMGALSSHMIAYAQVSLQMVGDVNGDGKINNRDLGCIQQYLNGWNVSVEEGADVNGDSKVNNRDMGELQQMLNEEEKQTKAATSTPYTVLGAPASAFYNSARLVSRCPWDMAIHDGRLYVGCGDYDKNTGPTPIISAPLSDPDNWRVDAWLPDEQVGRFIDYGGVLTVPGFDPQEQPQYGTYYELVDDEWLPVAVLPHGLHNFDLAWFEGQLFASIGAPGGCSPVVVTDDGVNFRDIPMYKNGELVVTEDNSVVRSMNLYILSGTLYADFWYQSGTQARSAFEMYRYNPDEDILEFVADMKQATHGGLYGAAGLPLWEKEALDDKMFLTTGYLYYTSDMEQYTQLTLPNNAVAYDMMAYDGRMYILAAYQSGSQYQITVYSTTAASPTKLRTEASFLYEQMPVSMVMDDDNFFIGTGYWYGNGASNNGFILQIQR